MTSSTQPKRPKQAKTQGKTQNPNQAQPAAANHHQWVDVMVEFEHLAPDQPTADRGERYRLLRVAAEHHREQLEAWITEEGLEEQVKQLGDVTAFDLLFARVTPAAADALQHAPGVVAVMPATNPPNHAGANGLQLRYA